MTPHWTQAQQDLCWELYNTPGVEIAFWNSDQHGRPCNGGTGGAPPLGVWQDGPPYARPCGAGTYHATTEPHRWAGCRVWVVAVRDVVLRETDKLAARGRMVVGEVLPEEALIVGVAARIGRRDLSGAYLSGANLSGADLHGGSLSGADLHGANLHGANLRGADLHGGSLSGADFHGANLRGADLSGADLRGADLRGADLSGAYLRGADPSGANFRGADLSGAYLRGADPSGANFRGADLSGAYLRGADLRGARYFVGTVWPVGFDPAAAGAVLVS